MTPEAASLEQVMTVTMHPQLRRLHSKSTIMAAFGPLDSALSQPSGIVCTISGMSSALQVWR